MIGSQKIWDRGAALTSTLHGFETEMLASEENLLGLMALNRELVGQAEAFDDSERVVLDMDSTESPVHGQQEGSAYNGHFESVCYHPLLLFNQHGDCLAAKLRPGNVPSADDWEELLLPEIERQQAEGKKVTFRADAAFAKPEIYEPLEERGVDYAIRIPANKSLELEIEDLHGQQESSAYNGHFESVCYHPLLLFNQHGDCLAAKLRPGNDSAEDWDELGRRLSANRLRASSPSGAMRPLPSRKFMSLRRNAACSTPSAFRPTGAWS